MRHGVVIWLLVLAYAWVGPACCCQRAAALPSNDAANNAITDDEDACLCCQGDERPQQPNASRGEHSDLPCKGPHCPTCRSQVPGNAPLSESKPWSAPRLSLVAILAFDPGCWVTSSPMGDRNEPAYVTGPPRPGGRSALRLHCAMNL